MTGVPSAQRPVLRMVSGAGAPASSMGGEGFEPPTPCV
jgi:hypothetical protein